MRRTFVPADEAISMFRVRLPRLQLPRWLGGPSDREQPVQDQPEALTALESPQERTEAIEHRWFTKPRVAANDEIVHPVYLDVPMLASFDAALNPEVAVAKEVQAEAEHDRSLSAHAELTGRFLAASAEAGFKADIAERNSAMAKLTFAFQRTAASRFNRVRKDLAKATWTLAESQTNDGTEIAVGQLLELRGEISLNPFDRLLDTYDRVLPWAGIRPRAPASAKSESPRLFGVFAPRALDDLMGAFFNDRRNTPKLVGIMRDDLNKNAVRDLVMKVDGDPPRWAVLVVRSAFFTRETADYILDGNFTVLGKVTQIYTADRPVINAARRTALAQMQGDRARDLMRILRDDLKQGGGSAGVFGPLVSGPAIQLMPLAIFV